MEGVYLGISGGILIEVWFFGFRCVFYGFIFWNFILSFEFSVDVVYIRKYYEFL